MNNKKLVAVHGKSLERENIAVFAIMQPTMKVFLTNSLLVETIMLHFYVTVNVFPQTVIFLCTREVFPLKVLPYIV